MLGLFPARRATTAVLVPFSAAAAVLAAMGIYSVLAYQVAGRRHEIGVRMALGATVDRVANGVVRRGLLLSGVGLLLGIPAAMAATRLIRSSLFGIEPLDPLTHAVVSLLVGIVATGACLLPARRAARVDPVTAFRSD
ncbi:MAG TPA: FtsX-like permease family protein [Gemmatimonadetes bacterium]|nr:FtsX-like permease family protein [Gemmatimonadota bacterium]